MSVWVVDASVGIKWFVAGHADLEQLDSLVAAAGEDPEAVALEHVDSDDVYLGAAEHD